MTSTNRDLVRAMLAAGAALSALPVAKLPALCSVAFLPYRGPHIEALVGTPEDDPAVQVAAVAVWARALPGGQVHARPHNDRWHVSARGELGTVPVEVWDLVTVDGPLHADLTAAGDSAVAGALLVERLTGPAL